jgi:hypothetical protein
MQTSLATQTATLCRGKKSYTLTTYFVTSNSYLVMNVSYLAFFLFIFSLWYSFASRPSSPWISAISLLCFFS